LPEDLIFVEAEFAGRAGDPGEITARMDEIMARREATQPVRERTGGSTFKNPTDPAAAGRSSWQLVDAVGGRGRVVGDAQMSELHCNFMINRGAATARDLETLGEGIRADVRAQTGVELEWEIRRIGDP
jgi:UDP-N-acetylmuramate dehydrogenase